MPVSICIFFTAISFTANAQSTKPNVIFILADDIGYEIPTVNGGQSYSTPNIDSMARNGMNFTHCEASPLCSPSRFMLLTGKYNFRNYSVWGIMNNGEKTIGNVMHDAGYKTGWFGKLQLTGLDSDMINRGFDSYLVLETLSLPNNGQRYKNPDLYTNGSVRLPDSLINGKYADDLFTQRLLAFIDSNKNNPFFAYFPMSLAHTPFGPTPDDTAFAGWDPRAPGDSTYFPSMVKYMDKLVGQVLQHLRDDGIDSNTIVIFSGDNGTTNTVVSEFDGGLVEGGKAVAAEAGTHEPLMMYWPGHITPGIDSCLIDFTDFVPTLANAAGTTDLTPYGTVDGISFYAQLFGDTSNQRQWIFNHYDANPDFDGRFWRWAQTKTYKLYDSSGAENHIWFPGAKSGNFYNIVTDPLEQNPLPDADLDSAELAIKDSLQTVLSTMPEGDNFPVLDSIFATNITHNSATLGARIESDGGSPVLYHGSILDYAPQPPSFFHSNHTDTISGIGTFQNIRTGLSPQHLYNYSLFATNGNKDDNTGYAQGSFWTCSSPPAKQPTSFTAKAMDCSVILKWNKATYPPVNATKAGYLLVYSTDSIKIDSNYRQRAPSSIVLHGTILPIKETNLPALPVLTDTVTNLSHGSTYHFLLIPYTWNGTNDSTHNYLITGALTVSDTALASQIVLSATVKKPSCFGYSDGSITLSSTKGLLPYQYSINSGAYDTSSVRTVAAGTFAVTVKDFAGCTASKSVIVTQPTALGLTVTHTNDSCYGGNNASMKFVGKGGTLPYLYNLNGSADDTVSIFNQLTAGTYTASIEDKNECTVSQPVLITQPVALWLSISHNNDSCMGAQNAYVKLFGKGGTRPYQYSFNGSAYDTVSTFTGLAAGTYNVSVKDKYLCTFSTSVAITQSPKACPASLASSADISGSIANPDELKISVYPNPSASQFQLVINNGNPYQPIFIKVVDMYGKPVFRQYSATAGTYTFGNGFATGVYLVQVQKGYQVKTLKVLKGTTR